MNSSTPSSTSMIKRIEQMFTNLDETPRKVLLVGLIFLFIMTAATSLVLAYYIYQPDLGAFIASPTHIPLPTSTPQCVQPTLSLGASTYPVDVTTLSTTGTLPAPGGPAGTAWWVSNTFSPFVFQLIPGIGSPDLQTKLKVGDPLVVQWADCGREEFVLTEVMPGGPDVQSLLAQTSPGIVVVVPATSISPGYVIYGQRPEIVNPPTPEPTIEVSLMIDITFEGTSVSADQQTIQTRLTITNRGSQSISLTDSDLALTAEGQAPLSPLQVLPGLPQEIQPGGSIPLVVTFPNPGGHTAVLHVLDVTVDLYY